MDLRVYEANGKWIVAGERFKVRFNTAQEAHTMADAVDFINDAREDITMFLDVRARGLERRRKYLALNYNSVLTDAHFAGENADITKADLVAAFTAMLAIYDAIDAATEAKLYKVQR